MADYLRSAAERLRNAPDRRGCRVVAESTLGDEQKGISKMKTLEISIDFAATMANTFATLQKSEDPVIAEIGSIYHRVWMTLIQEWQKQQEPDTVHLSTRGKKSQGHAA